MIELTPMHLNLLKTRLLVGDKKHNAKVRFETIDGRIFETMKISSIDLDRRVDKNCAEATIKLDNTLGYYAPDYNPEKFPEFNLKQSPYSKVLWPNTKVQIWIGYGDNLKLQFTGLIDRVTMNSSPSVITIKCRDMYKLILNHYLDRNFSYTNWAVSGILQDIIIKNFPDLNVFVDEILVWDEKLQKYTEYMIKGDASFKYGENLGDKIQELIGKMNHRAGADASGVITFKEIEYKNQNMPHDHEYHDSVNLKDLEYNIDDSFARSHYRITSSGLTYTFKNQYLYQEVCGGRLRLAHETKIDWADTYEKQKLAAKSYFGMLLRRFRSISCGTIGNPNLELLDLVKINNLSSSAIGKYQVMGIRTSFSNSGYFDVLDLDYGVTETDVQDANSDELKLETKQKVIFMEDFTNSTVSNKFNATWR